jgi:hypothetical protein
MKKVKEMNLPLGSYAILGSGPLAVRGLRDSKDIDLIVTPEIYKEYRKKKGWKLRFAYGRFFLRNENIEIWKSIGPGKWNIKKLIKDAEIIEGLPFVNLKDFSKWKRKSHRKKDRSDVELVDSLQ